MNSKYLTSNKYGNLITCLDDRLTDDELTDTAFHQMVMVWQELHQPPIGETHIRIWHSDEGCDWEGWFFSAGCPTEPHRHVGWAFRTFNDSGK